jgi:glutathione synthase/RimK-type ligase-like ATP-grasp enzyme
MIIIFANPQDDHSILVAQKLMRNHQEQPFILDLSKLPQDMSIEAHYNTNINFKINFPGGRYIDLGSVKSFWWRRPQPLILDPRIRDQTHREFAYNEWRTALYGMWQSTDCLWVNDISKDQSAENKPYQLTVAKRTGLLVPETLITNNSSEAVNFWTQHQGKVVFKTFSATDRAWRETRPLTQETLSLISTVHYAPVIFQEYIGPALDVRITIIGDEIFAAETRTNEGEYQYDWRMSIASSWKEHDLPGEVKDLLLKYMKGLGLEYGSIDMRLTPDGQYYFLEINTAGQFLFIEYEVRLPISDAIAKHLARGVKSR